MADGAPAPKNCRILMCDRGAIAGFICPGGGLSFRRQDAILFTRAKAKVAKMTLSRAPRTSEHRATFSVAED
jgi:hypothetical protein